MKTPYDLYLLNSIDKLEAQKTELLEALKLAREYVHANHMVVVCAMGHEQTVIKPDLDKIDAAIAGAK